MHNKQSFLFILSSKDHPAGLIPPFHLPDKSVFSILKDRRI